MSACGLQNFSATLLQEASDHRAKVLSLLGCRIDTRVPAKFHPLRRNLGLVSLVRAPGSIRGYAWMVPAAYLFFNPAKLSRALQWFNDASLLAPCSSKRTRTSHHRDRNAFH